MADLTQWLITRVDNRKSATAMADKMDKRVIVIVAEDCPTVKNWLIIYLKGELEILDVTKDLWET